jgi:hypothetical protein
MYCTCSSFSFVGCAFVSLTLFLAAIQYQVPGYSPSIHPSIKRALHPDHGRHFVPPSFWVRSKRRLAEDLVRHDEIAGFCVNKKNSKSCEHHGDIFSAAVLFTCASPPTRFLDVLGILVKVLVLCGQAPFLRFQTVVRFHPAQHEAADGTR